MSTKQRVPHYGATRLAIRLCCFVQHPVFVLDTSVWGLTCLYEDSFPVGLFCLNVTLRGGLSNKSKQVQFHGRHFSVGVDQENLKMTVWREGDSTLQFDLLETYLFFYPVPDPETFRCFFFKAYETWKDQNREAAEMLLQLAHDRPLERYAE